MFLSFRLNSLGSSRSLTSFGSLFQSWLALKVNDFRYISSYLRSTIGAGDQREQLRCQLLHSSNHLIPAKACTVKGISKVEL